MKKISRKLVGLRSIAYFSMEVGVNPAMPTYSGGLGILAGDTLRAAADLDVPMIGVTLLHGKGYFRQHLDNRGNQSETSVEWNPDDFLQPRRPRVCIIIEDRPVQIRVWLYTIVGVSGHKVPLYFLDTDLAENAASDRRLTDHLYGGDERYRLCQEAVLGIGGVIMLRALGYRNVRAYHMNEGHSALLALALLERGGKVNHSESMTGESIDTVRRQCIFTTHTPVPAGHDQFPMDLVRHVLGEDRAKLIEAARCCVDGILNMTYLALFFSHYVNGVSHRHGEISQSMFPSYPINSVTNGVHAVTWTSPPFQALYDRHIEEWRRDNLYLRYATSIPLEEIMEAHARAKEGLLREIERRTRASLEARTITIGFARRATLYKRADLLFSDLDRLREIARQVGPIQIIYGGKAHPKDEGGKAMIRRIFETISALKDTVRVVYVEEYDMALAKQICAGVDLWLNTPQKPREASGTSGMKAALNGVPSLSVLDGWWIEGHVEGVTGWAIGNSWESESNPATEVASLYDKLESVIIPMFYRKPHEYVQVMRSAIALNGSFFNAQRMISQYMQNAYFATGKPNRIHR